MPSKADPTKNWKYPKALTAIPEKPLINFPGKVIRELKSAYCVAVNSLWVNPDK
jgi:hypothetical protein